MSNGKKIGLLLTAAAMSAGLWFQAQAAVYEDDTASSYVNRLYTELQDSGMEEWLTGGGSADAGNGPGAASKLGDGGESRLSGPVVHEVTMAEKYHSEFNLYEQSIGGQYFIYSNVSNGGVTDQPVYVEIPADVACTVEKDGVPMVYGSGQMLSARGTYVFRFTAVYDKNVPLSQQEEYRAVFRFRIDKKQEDPQSVAAAASGAADALTREIDGLTGGNTQEALDELASGLGGLKGDSISDSPASDEDEDVKGGDKEETKASEEGAGEIQEKDAPEDGALTGDEEGGGEKAEEEDGEDTSPAATRSQVYIKDEAMYQVTLENGFTFRSSVPEGMIINQSVALYIEEGSPYTLYKGEEEVSLNQRQEVTEYGAYRLVSGDLQFTFEINNTYVNRSLFTAPVGTTIRKAVFEDTSLNLGDGRSIPMEEDGVYRFTLGGEYGEELEVVLNRDTQAPQVEVQVSGQTAQITYSSDDIASITLSEGGEEPQAFAGALIEGPGSYVLAVTDRAGNETVREFTLHYRVNVYGVIAIVVAAAGITSAIIILIRKKKNLTVR